MRNPSLLAAFVAAMVLSSAAQAAQDPTGCIDGDAWIGHIKEKNPNLPVQSVTELPPEVLVEALALYNEGQAEAIQAQTGIAIMGPTQAGGTPGLLGFFSDGCLVGDEPFFIPAGSDA
jgi:hypothetical protein